MRWSNSRHEKVLSDKREKKRRDKLNKMLDLSNGRKLLPRTMIIDPAQIDTMSTKCDCSTNS